jgi:hypothetical protein
MPDATITSTASTFGTISGTFAADQSTVTGTISGIITGTLTGSVGVPGPAGPGVPAGGSSGQFLQKTSGADYATDWVTVNLTGLATEAWVTAGFYPLTGNPSGFLTSSSLTGYATESWVTSQGYITTSALTPYLTKADNLGSLTNFATARDNLSLGTLNTPVFAGLTAQGSGSNVANLTPTSLTLTHSTFGSFVIQPSSGITFPDSSVQTTAFTTAQLTNYLAKASNLSDLPSAATARINLGLGSLAVVNDAPSDGSQYARKNGAWDVVASTPDFISSVSSPLSVTTGNLTIDLSAYAPLASPAFTGTPTAPTPSPGTDSTQIATTEWVKDFDYAPTNSPHFTGNPQSVTPNLSDDDTSIATTAFVKGQGYITSSALTGYATESWVTSQGYLTSASLTGYATESWVTAGFYPLTGNPSGFLTSSSLTGYATESWVTSQLGSYLTTADAASTYLSLAAAANDYYPSSNPLGFITAYESDLNYLKQSYNLSDLTDASAARTNLGLGTMATASASDYSTTTVANGLYYPLSSNPAGYLTSAPVTSVAGKTGAVTLAVADVSGAAPLASPTFTGTPSLPTGTIGVTQTAGNSTTALATTAFVTTADNLKANLASPTFTGTPAAPTAAAGTNTTQIATTAFVRTDNNVKAWVNFNGTGTVAIRSSFNVTSITDVGTGAYIANYTNAISANAAGHCLISDDATTYRFVCLQGTATNNTTTSFKVSSFQVIGSTFNQVDPNTVMITIIR